MKYCENCKVFGEFEACPACGSKNTREPAEGDYCFLMECSQDFGERLDSYLAEEGISAVLLPTGNGVRSVLGLTLENYRVFVPYGSFDQASEIKTVLIKEPIERMRKDLLEHFDKWHFKKESGEKKLKKKLKLSKDADLLSYVKAQVESTEHISDGGPRYAGGGHILSVRTEGGSVLFDSLSYEILI